MTSPRLRPATVDDLPLLLRHRRAMWVSIGGSTPVELDAHDRVYRRWARDGLRAGTIVGFVIDDDGMAGAASGCLWLSPSQPRPGMRGLRVPYLLSMYTEPSRRGRGHADRIVRAALRWSRAHGYDRVLLHASSMGRGIYERSGFQRTNEMRRMLRPGGASAFGLDPPSAGSERVDPVRSTSARRRTQRSG